VAYLVKARVGRSQGAVIFWGLVSAFFASAFCYYYLENRNNEETSRKLLDQVMTLQNEQDALTAERQKLEDAASNNEKQLDEREQFLQEKENNLAQEESQLEAMGPHGQGSAGQTAQAAGVKKFDDAVRKLAAKVPDADVLVRSGRPVLRVPSSYLFDSADDHLKPDGKALLNQVAQASTGTLGRFELRVETFTDSAGEIPAANPASAPPAKEQAGTAVDAWTLTTSRAGAIAHYLRDSGALPFQNVLAVGRADFLPIESGSQSHGRNRRVEITITPMPAPFHAPEPTKAAHGKAGAPTASVSAETATPSAGTAKP
jgi:flagellar motor protein MotB